MSTPEGQTPAPVDASPVRVPDPRLRTIVLVRWGVILWAVALVVLLVVPPLRADGRDWWVWVPVAGIVLGVLGHAYLARGRGTAGQA